MSEINAKDYIDQVLVPNFRPMIEEQIYSTIIDRNHETVICTQLTAESIGFKRWQDVVGLSYRDYNDIAKVKAIFKEVATDENIADIITYCKKLFQIQEFVFSHKRIVSVIDLLPYDGKFVTYLINFVPVFHPTTAKVIAVQLFSIKSRFFDFHEQISTDNRYGKKKFNPKDFTRRELEILFLLANSVTQDQIGDILNISRSTVSSVIANQLCVKFEIPGSNTKLLSQAALKAGFHHHMPQSLYKPGLIILESELHDLLAQDQ